MASSTRQPCAAACLTKPQPLNMRSWQGQSCPYYSVEHVGRDLPAVRRELFHHALMQPDVHRRGIPGVARVTELARERFAVLEAGIHADELHQVHDRSAPVEFLTTGGSHLLQRCF